MFPSTLHSAKVLRIFFLEQNLKQLKSETKILPHSYSLQLYMYLFFHCFSVHKCPESHLSHCYNWTQIYFAVLEVGGLVVRCLMVLMAESHHFRVSHKPHLRVLPKWQHLLLPQTKLTKPPHKNSNGQGQVIFFPQQVKFKTQVFHS